MNTNYIKRGEIYYANLNPVVGSEQGNTRPVIVVQNDIGNKYSPTIVIVPITCSPKKKMLPTHVVIPKSSGLDIESRALVEQIRTINRSRIGEYIGCVGNKVQEEINNALAICVGIDPNHSHKAEILTLCLCQRCESDFWESGCILIKRGWQSERKLCDFCETRHGLEFGIFNNGQLPAYP